MLYVLGRLYLKGQYWQIAKHRFWSHEINLMMCTIQFFLCLSKKLVAKLRSIALVLESFLY